MRPGVGRFLVLASVFVCAACGLVYELELVALASYLIGDSVTQASIVLSVMVFAMGLGSLLAKRLCRRAAQGFGYIEALLALVGGGSAMALYACFAWFGESRTALVAFSLVIGGLIGAEMPLLMVLIQRIREQDVGGAVADLFAADYVGALAGGLAFPFLLLPLFGQLTGALLIGVVNVFAGGFVVLWLFRRDLTRSARAGLLLLNGVVLTLLLAALCSASAFEEAARRAVYGGTVRVATQSAVQEIVLTDGPAGGHGGREASRGLELFLDGRLRVCSSDEARYHQALVHPAMAAGRHARVLVLGGGDGLAVREVLRHPGVRSVTVVELDPAVLDLASRDPVLSALNQRSLADPRVRRVTADAFGWLRGRPASGGERYDVVVSGLPDPRITASTKLYSLEFYGLLPRVLADGGRLAVHAGAAGRDPHTYGTVAATLRAAGFSVTGYAVDGRLSSFGDWPDRAQRAEHPSSQDWGFLLASRGDAPRVGLPADVRSGELTAADLRRAVARAGRLDRRDLPPSTLVHPRYGF
ncbi:polyamine aminopropyltransferase [Streptomyces durbertensis]|uniref:Polyamine aminopropyltransferase n=1 Tax=Streptomyces durbertensis TaxID=2448886 RepID=A0ABR6EPB0_9ACTN|nr:polyamine aminopropyltransferase [Streptomyces durbertensis]MBB1246902.1 polyamine aminopropyltransferase [Streptomyces durbertensis]